MIHHRPLYHSRQWPRRDGDSPSSATALAVGSSRSGQIEPGGDVDYFRVQVSASGDLTVHTTGSLDTRGQLEDSAGGVLARDDDGGDGYNFRIAHAVSAGTYYIKVEGYNASTTGRYTIHASGPGGDGGPVNIPDANLRAAIAAELGKTPNEPITPDEMATLTFLAGWDQGIRDLTGLEFATNLETLDLGENLEIGIVINSNDVSNLSPLSGLTNLRWISLSQNSISDISPLSGLTNLTVLYLNDNSISDISPLVANTGLGSGDEVYLGNNPLSSTSLNTHIPALESRGVTVHYDGGGGGGDDHGDSPSAATALAVGSSRSGQIEPGGDVDYFRVQVSASGDLTVHTTGSLDTRGQLEDSAGAVLARDDDGGDGYNFRIAHAVSAGTYYLKVEGYNASTTGSYTIHASGPGGGDGPVNIPDANLRAAIADALGKAPNEPITPDEMATLIVLGASEQGIRDLTGLEFATNLEELWLIDNNISDLAPLSGLTRLKYLGLIDNSIADLAPLASLNNLEDLWLDDNSIADLAPLAGLTNLRGLGLDDNSIADLAPLSGLTRLAFLNLGFNNISDVAPLAGLTNLTELGLWDNGITDVSPLSDLTNLTVLWLAGNNITDVSSLSGLTNLIRLGLDDNSIADLSPLASLTNLEQLWLNENSISDLAPLVANTGLGSGDEVYLYDNPLSSTSLNTHIPALESRGVTVHYEGSAKVIAGDAKSSMQGRMNSPRSERLNRKSAR